MIFTAPFSGVPFPEIRPRMNLEPTERAALEAAELRYSDLARESSDPGIASRSEEMKRVGRGLRELEALVEAGRSWRSLDRERADLAAALGDPDGGVAELAREELPRVEARLAEATERVRRLLAERERGPEDNRGAVLEVRAGTGGEEAALFASQILRMYLRFAERQGWKAEMADMHQTEMGGTRDAVATIDGRGAWRLLKHEGGVHRVQRVPVTEASGRIHTSAVSVAVLPEAEELEVQVRPEDIRVDTFCSSGPGGQGVNTTYSAVRIVHVPTGIVVQCQDERSQIKNKARAMKVLQARILARMTEERGASRDQARKEQVRSGDRSEKVRTYNFPQNRVTDHRAGLTVHRLPEIMDGDLGEFLTALNEALRQGANGSRPPASADDDD
jgi:peptide chain release factor 1